jgi:hypothetical protein
MSGAGSIGAMITSMKNMKRTRISALQKLKENGRYSTNIELHFDKEASKHQLKTIREKIKKENQIRLRNKALIIISMILILIYIVGFVKL